MSRFVGIYAELLEQYINFKRGLGYKFTDAESNYFLFDQFTVQHNADKLGITKELADLWAVKRPNESDSTCYKRVFYLIHFAKYLDSIGYSSYIPKHLKNYKSTFIPYIFSSQEIKAIFSACDNLKQNNGMDSTINVIPAILRLLYGTGIRVGEAVSLGPEDVYLDTQQIIIRYSKNGKERIIPLSDSVSSALRQYKDSIQRSHAATFFCKTKWL